MDSAPASALEHSPVTLLPAVTPKLAPLLATLGLETVGALWFHLPLRYEDRTQLCPIAALIPGQPAQFEGTVEFTEVRFAGRRTLNIVLFDGSGRIKLRLFHFSAAQSKSLVMGTRLRCFGEVRAGLAGLECIHPQYRLLAPEAALELSESLSAVYPTTEGLPQTRLGKVIGQALDRLPEGDELEQLPLALRQRFALAPLRGALLQVHRPSPDSDMPALLERRHPAQRRLAFDELLAHQLAMRLHRRRYTAMQAPALEGSGLLVRQLLAQLPFQLTVAQQRVFREIAKGLAQPVPMLRLVQGDVGSGKTVVAALAALQAIEAGRQVALMAPTELLAEQHLRNFARWLEPLGIQPVWLAGKVKGRARAQALAALAQGAPMTIGTHALMQDQVGYADLGLVIIDEQHRFGVHQRLSLRDKGLHGVRVPHQLVMTATPIPRTLAMVAYADLDVSVIDELPPGRTPVRTVAIDSQRRTDVVRRIHEACQAGRQAYWVCTLIDESDQLEAQAAQRSHALLTEALPDLRIGLLHGRMKPAEKQECMQRFTAGELELLVATTVIEVGVDVPNASLMVIENAERLGLSQLHQLRGRVGRGAQESACVLLYQGPLGQLARERLQIMRETTDGFRIAEADLRLRGPGEFLGTRQAGFASYRVADLVRDQDQLETVRAVADRWLEESPQTIAPLLRRWLGAAERLADA